MKTNYFGILAGLALLLALASCKKDESVKEQVQPESLTSAASGGMLISNHMQAFILSSITVAADSGVQINFPSGSDKMHFKAGTAQSDDYSWTGPDANGWYTRYLSGLYDYYEKVRFGDTIEYVNVISYSGGDGSYENITTTRYIKEIKDGKTLYNGESHWEVKTFGDNDISHWEWRISFTDWDPATSAGVFDWFWGISENSGGETVPYHRSEHLVVTETTPDGWLHCRAIYYDDSGVETWDCEYDTPWSPVQMPVIPGWGS